MHGTKGSAHGTTGRKGKGAGSGLPVLLLLVLATLLLPASIRADLLVEGSKDFSFADYSLDGSLTQFLNDYPLFMQKKGFDQALRLNVKGTLGRRVHVEASLDDTSQVREDEKLLVAVDGERVDAALGRITLDLPPTKYLLFNKKGLGAFVTADFGRGRLQVFGGRPEGHSVRNFFQGQGNLSEYVLKGEDGSLNPEVVQGSEIVELDGRRLRRGTDYEIDYLEGSIVLKGELLPIEATSRLTVHFETLKGGGAYQNTIWGARATLFLRGDGRDRRPRGPLPSVLSPSPPLPMLKPVEAPADRTDGDLLPTTQDLNARWIESGIDPTPSSSAEDWSSPADPGQAVPTAPAATRSAVPAATPAAAPAENGAVSELGGGAGGLSAFFRNPAVMPAPPSSSGSAPLLSGGRQDFVVGASAVLAASPPATVLPVTGVSVNPVPLSATSSAAGRSVAAVSRGGTSNMSDVERLAHPPLPDGDYVAFSVVTDADDRSLQSTDPVVIASSPLPRKLTVMGADARIDLPRGFRFAAETAVSELDPDTMFHGKPVVKGSVVDATLSRKTTRHEFSANRLRIEPGFQAVGRTEFTRIGRDSDLSSNVDATTVSQKVKLGDRVDLETGWKTARGNLAGDPTVKTDDYAELVNTLRVDRKADRGTELRTRKEDRDIFLNGALDSVADKRYLAVVHDRPLGSLHGQVKFERDENHDLTGNAESYRTGKFHLGSRRKGPWSWSADRTVQNVDKEALAGRAREMDLTSLSVNWNRDARLQSSITASHRRELNFDPSDTSRPGKATVDTGEGKLRWAPNDRLNFSFKGSAEERNRILVVTADEDSVLATASTTRTSSTLVTDNPVLTSNFSHIVEFRPHRKVNGRVNLRGSQERDVVDRTLYSRNDSVDWRLQVAPTTRIRATMDGSDGTSYNLNANIDKENGQRRYEVVNNFDKRTALVLSRDDREQIHRNAASTDSFVLEDALKIEKRLDDRLKLAGGCRRVEKDEGARSVEKAVDLGIQWNPNRKGPRWELNFSDGDVTGTDTGGSPFLSHNRKFQLRLDDRISKDTRLSGNLEIVSKGPDGKGSDGYRATVAEVKVNVEF